MKTGTAACYTAKEAVKGLLNKPNKANASGHKAACEQTQEPTQVAHL